MSNKKSIGIVTRTKNRTVLLRRAIENIINQSYDNWHLVIVNDGGDPEPVNMLVNKYLVRLKGKVHVIHNEQSVGMEAASNLGLKYLNTEYATIHDDDDSWSPAFLERCITVLEKERETFPSIKGIVSYTNRVLETVKGNSIIVSHTEPFNHWIKPGLLPLDRMLFENMFPPISFIFSLSSCKELGYFNEKLPVLGDWEFHIRFLLHHDIWVLPEAMAFYHHRLDSTGSLGNTVIAGLDKHEAYRNLLINQWLRDDLKGEGNGLGIYINNRTHIEYVYRILNDTKHDINKLSFTCLNTEKNSWNNSNKLNNITEMSRNILNNTIRTVSFIDKLRAKIKNPFKKIGD